MADNETEDVALAALRCIGMLLVLLLLILLRSMVLTKLWDWFIVPLGVLPIGLAHAYGLALTATMFTDRYAAKSSDKETGVKVFAYGFAMPLLALGIGWICKSFM
jgi:hypothetical protein